MTKNSCGGMYQGSHGTFITFNGSRYTPASAPLDLPVSEKLAAREHFKELRTYNLSEVRSLSAQVKAIKMEEEKYEAVLAEMEAFWPILKDKLMQDKVITRHKLCMDWLDMVLEFNAREGKKFRGLGMVLFFRSYFPDFDNNKEVTNFEGVTVTKDQIYALAWAIEIMQAACLIADDMMDNSRTRRGKPCWHLVDGVGLLAINDIVLLENVAYRIVDLYIRRMPYFAKCTRVIHKTAVITLLGEHLDIKSEIKNNNGDLSVFTEELYAKIVEAKTSYYTFYTPVQCAMISAGRKGKQEFKSVRAILLRIGHLFQGQDDYLDCFGDVDVTGKIGTDIADGKCTWLIVKALQLASPEQKVLLRESYGTKDGEGKVKAIYRELKIPKEYMKFEDEIYNEIVAMIDNLPEEVPTKQIHHFLNVIYRREK